MKRGSTAPQRRQVFGMLQVAIQLLGQVQQTDFSALPELAVEAHEHLEAIEAERQYEQPRQDRYRVVMGTVFEVVEPGQFVEHVVLDRPAAVPDSPDNLWGIALQLRLGGPAPVGLHGFAHPAFGDLLCLDPGFIGEHDSGGFVALLGEGEVAVILRGKALRLLGAGQCRGLMKCGEPLLFEDADHPQPRRRTARINGVLVYQASRVTTSKKRGPYRRRIQPSIRSMAPNNNAPLTWAVGILG